MTTLMVEEYLPPGVRALYSAIKDKPIEEISGIALRATDKQTAMELLVDVGLNPGKYPGVDPIAYDSECAQAAHLLEHFDDPSSEEPQEK